MRNKINWRIIERNKQLYPILGLLLFKETEISIVKF